MGGALSTKSIVVGAGHRIGPGGSPGYLYVLYGESIARCRLRMRLSLKLPTAYLTVGHACRSIPLCTRLR